LILVDLDQFGEVNLQYGLLAGNQVLQTVARVLRGSLREADLVARSGGDEFAILLPETPIIHYDLASKPKMMAAGAAAAERIRQVLAGTPIDTLERTLRITASLGVAEADPSCTEFQSLLSRAETAVALARSLGSNQVHLWQAEAENL
jgi:diguanylate cyclase (GGDEF)-like protein